MILKNVPFMISTIQIIQQIKIIQINKINRLILIKHNHRVITKQITAVSKIKMATTLLYILGTILPIHQI